MNDGGLDRQGRFIVGGIEEENMSPVTPVWSVTPDGQRKIIENVGCANSLVFSPEGTTLHFADTAATTLFAYDYDTGTGTPTNRRIFAELHECGNPDGSTIDADGNLRNARFGGACVMQFNPDGTAFGKVAPPVPNVTCCVIGGTNMNRLFITTARSLMSDAELADKPQAGGLFVTEIDTKGIPAGVYIEQVN